MNNHLFFQFYFDSLLDIAQKSGLDFNETKLAFEDEAYLKMVNNDLTTAKKKRISSVPFFIINEKHILSGAQSVEYFKNTLLQIDKKETSLIENIK